MYGSYFFVIIDKLVRKGKNSYNVIEVIEMIKKENLPECPVATTVSLIGSKWKLLILRDLLTGTKRNGELKKSLPEISQKVLTESLKSMVEDGIVERIAYPEVPPRVEYKLTELGESMRPVISVMEQWGKEYKESI